MFNKAFWVQFILIMLYCFVVTFTDRMVYSGMQNKLLQCLWNLKKICKNIGGRLGLLTSIYNQYIANYPDVFICMQNETKINLHFTGQNKIKLS